ncbi:hypothetical protein [Mycolicibacterium sp.]|uniref:hypothetical protein n=1 Tax=Mycolicibacterium sp. TaxID=2320850 RepID=UPI001A2B06A7|nr:hypothetical protein [Mycolicibacterium sp.]MBJ7401572.1 hypothetical protein [Mycolicibacterium sp.]
MRSQLIAGVAALSATAVTVAPIAQPDLLASPQQVSAAIQLSAFANPVTELLGTLALTSEFIFWQDSLPSPSDLFWPDSFYNSDFTFVYAPINYGLLPDALNQFSSGALSAVLTNLSGYIDTTVYGATGVAIGVSDAVFNTPFALITAAQLALAGQVDAAIAELQAQILAPLQDGIATGVQAGTYILNNVVANATTLLTDTLPRLVSGLVDATVEGTTFLVQAAIGVATDVVSNLASANIEGAWNAAVNGLLDPGSGLLGAVVALTVGVGNFEDIDYPDIGVVETVTPPSIRSVLTSVGQRVGDFSDFGDGGIRNNPCCTVASAAAVTAPTAARQGDSAPAEVEVAAPVAERPAADTESAAADASPSRAKTSVARASDRATKGSARAARTADRAAKAAASG